MLKPKPSAQGADAAVPQGSCQGIAWHVRANAISGSCCREADDFYSLAPVGPMTGTYLTSWLTLEGEQQK